MLDFIPGGLTNVAKANASLAVIGDEELLERVKNEADKNAVAPWTYVAATVRHLLDPDSEEIWLELIDKMANLSQPGATALKAILLCGFTAPTKLSAAAAPP